MNDVTLRNGRQLEDPVVKRKTIEDEVESEKPRSEKVVVESEEPNAPPPYKPKIHFPQGFDKSKLDEQFRKFIEIIQDKLPPKLKDRGSFSIPCVIGPETRGVRGPVWIGFETKYHPIQNKNHKWFGSVWMIILKKSEPIRSKYMPFDLDRFLDIQNVKKIKLFVFFLLILILPKHGKINV